MISYNQILHPDIWCYHFSGISGDLEMAGNSAKARERSGT